MFCQKQRKENKIQVLMQHKFVCHLTFRGISHQNAFLRINWH